VQSFYRPGSEKDNCGFGLIAQMDSQPSHWLLHVAIGALARLIHRSAVATDGFLSHFQTLADLREYVKNLGKFCARPTIS